tara:strand:+ start:3243 stop:3554 length:312 start_codon:yes stop_codon:yes gene_type:complete
MKVLTLILVFIAIIIFLEIVKHRVSRDFSKIMLYIVVGIIFLLIVAAFVDLSTFFDSGNGFTQTGAAVVDAVGENAEIPDLRESEFIENIKEKIDGFMDKDIE